MKILVSGVRSYVAIDWAVALMRAGMEPVLADSFPSYTIRKCLPDLTFHRYPSPAQNPAEFVDSIQTLCRKEKIDWIIPTSEEIFYLAEHSEVFEPTRLLAPAIDLLKRLHSKQAFLDITKEAGLPIPETFPVSAKRSIPDHPEDWVLKRIYTRFGANTITRLNARAWARAQTESPQWLAQRKIEGTEYCTWSVFSDGELKIHTTYQPIYRLRNSSAFYFKGIHHAEIKSWVERFAISCQLDGQIAFDFILKNDGSILPIDCNPRTTSGIHLLAGDPAMIEAIFKEKHECLENSEQPFMLPLAMRQFGLPRALYQGQLRSWWQHYSTASKAPCLPISRLCNIRNMFIFVGRAMRNRCSFRAAITEDMDWPPAR